jgi:hypothetical protein
LKKICYFDPFSGISGDMTVGALVDAGADWAALKDALDSLDLGATVMVEKANRKGIAASQFKVQFEEQKKHRHLSHIQKIILGGKLTERAQKNALAVFQRLGEAEARSHSVPLEKVHFHEVGAVDSICDIVGACAALDLLDIDEVRGSKINVGSGTVNTEHGVLPVPAPATADLLRDAPIYSAGPEFELTTPTGAAIITTLASGYGDLPPVKVLAQGFGAGDKDFATQANVLRVLICERTEATEATSINVLEANVDDCTPQVLGYAMEQLLAAGALDVTLTPIVMKKNRAATMISVLSLPPTTDQLVQILFRETTTLGIRILNAERRVLYRESAHVETKFGAVRVKYTENGSFTPEYDDCRALAQQFGIPLRAVIAEANEAFAKQRRS